MNMICLDLEGVLIPDIWEEVSKAMGIPELMRTTKEEPDFAKLMRYRLEIAKKNNLKIDDIWNIVAGLVPMEGAIEFLDELRKHYQVTILTDSYYEYISPLIQKLNNPAAFAHRLTISDDGVITDFHLRVDDQKTVTVKSFQQSGFKVVAAGDSYNDLGMIGQADAGMLFRTTEQIAEENPELATVYTYAEFRAEIDRVAQDLDTHVPFREQLIKQEQLS